jgi:chorismate--pyruvate lyase
MILSPKQTKFKEPSWRKLKAIPRNHIPAFLYPWLSEAHSMTKRLEQHSNKFEVHIVEQSWRIPFTSERLKLEIPTRQLALIREVELICDGKPWIFARTVMPKKLFTGKEKRLCKLDNTPIGKILFANPSLWRTPFEIARITKNHYFYQPSHGKLSHNSFIWGRRSVFYLANKPLLITEIFTPWLEHQKKS